MNKTLKVMWVIGLSLTLLLAIAAGVLFYWVVQSFQPKPVQLPLLPPTTQITVDDRPLPPADSARIVAEINALRAQPWMTVDGKISAPALFFVAQPPAPASAVHFSLDLQGDITQSRNPDHLTTAGGYFTKVDPQRQPALAQLRFSRTSLPSTRLPQTP